MLAKTLGRRKEIAIRSALGASRIRIVQQVLCETVLLALTGGIFGLLIAQWGVRLISAFLADQLSLSPEIKLDVWVLGFTLAVSSSHRGPRRPRPSSASDQNRFE